MKYRWEELLDGQAHIYRQGRDFDCLPADFAKLVRSTAREFGLAAAVQVDGVFVAFQSHPVEEPAYPDEPSAVPAHLDEAVKMRLDGATWRAIGDRFGVSVTTVRRHILLALEKADG